MKTLIYFLLLHTYAHGKSSKQHTADCANGTVQRIIAYVANDGMASNVITALKAAGLNGKVLVTGQDATTAGIHNILAGDQGMTIYKPIGRLAQSVGELVKALHNGSNVGALTRNTTASTVDGGNIPAILDTPIAVDRTNIATTVIADKFIAKKDVCNGIPAGTANVC